MALTKAQALKQAQDTLRQQLEGTGSKSKLDQNYVNAYATDLMNQNDKQVAQYTQQAVDLGMSQRPSKPREEREYSPLVDALTQTTTATTIAPTRPKDTNLTDLMTQQSKAQTDATLNAIRQRIAESKANQQSLIDKAGQQYQPLRNESEVAKSQQLTSALERSANMGDRGGIGRQEALATQTEGENRLNQINLQQQNFVDSANQEISRLENEGKFQEAQAVYEQRSRDLQNAIEEARRQEEIQRSDEQIRRQEAQRQQELSIDEQRYQDTQALRQGEQSREDFGASIGANYNDLQAYANQLRQQGAPEWQINQVLSARQGKLGDIAKGQSEQQSALYKMAMDKWESGIPVNAQEANALGVRVGSTKPVKSSGGGGGLTNAQEWSRIKDKIDMGIPLTPQEQAILGGNPTQTGTPISDDFAVSGMEEIVKRYTPEKGLAGYLQKTFNSQDKDNEMLAYLQQLDESGYPERELKLLASRYGITLKRPTSTGDSTRQTTN